MWLATASQCLFLFRQLQFRDLNIRSFFRKVYLLKAAKYRNMVKVEIDLEGCIQCGRCYDEACSDIFIQTDDGTSNISEKYRTSGPEAGEVPENMFDCAAKAAEECPVDVISIQK